MWILQERGFVDQGNFIVQGSIYCSRIPEEDKKLSTRHSHSPFPLWWDIPIRFPCHLWWGLQGTRGAGIGYRRQHCRSSHFKHLCDPTSIIVCNSLTLQHPHWWGESCCPSTLELRDRDPITTVQNLQLQVKARRRENFFPEQTSNEDSFPAQFYKAFHCTWTNCENSETEWELLLRRQILRSSLVQIFRVGTSHVAMFALPAATQLSVAHSEFALLLLWNTTTKIFSNHLSPLFQIALPSGTQAFDSSPPTLFFIVRTNHIFG